MVEKYFTVDARAMLTWGRDSIKDHTTAVLELVKNSYDAGARIVEVSILAAAKDPKARLIRISDDGVGMSGEQVDKNWLRIGYSDKLKSKKARFGRRKTGEKGVGRISADRLGSGLELRTQAKEVEAAGLDVDWKAFEQPGKVLSEVKIPAIQNPQFAVPSPSKFDKKHGIFLDPPAPKKNSKQCTGTELRIRSLRHKWTVSDVQDLQQELSILTPPFKPVEDFQIRINNDLDPKLDGVLTSPFYQTAEIEADFSYSGNGNISYRIKDRNDSGEPRRTRTITTNWNEFVHLPSRAEGTEEETGPNCGPIDVKLLFYPRIERTLRGTELTLRDLKDFLDLNAGIKVYRDNIRVMPYGSIGRPEGDWLGLGDRKARNPAGPGRESFQVGPNQIVGAVFLSRDRNPKIVDTSGREGLIHSDEFIQLRSFLVSGCLPVLEGRYHEIYSARKRDKDDFSPRDTIREVNKNLTELSKTLNATGAELPKSTSRKIERLRDQIGSTRARLQRLQKSSEELAAQATIYRGLATIGVTAATFGHETEITLQSCLLSLDAARRMLKTRSAVPNDVLEELAKAIEYGDRVSAWGAFALKRVRRDKRHKKPENITALLTELIAGLRPAFTASEIKIRERYDLVEGTTFAMDVESVALNLLTNAYYFSKLNRKERIVAVTLKLAKRNGKKGFEITVGDSGPGVRKEISDNIWVPLFSTKVDQKGRPFGTGLGLAIIDSVVKDIGGTRSVDTDPQLKGARFRVWLRLE